METLKDLKRALAEIYRGDTTAVRPRVHGNGFIQVDITPRVRAHFWGPSIPRQWKSPTPLHDHTFGFSSKVLGGQLINIRYEAITAARGFENYQVFRAQVRKGEDTILVPDARGALVRPLSVDIIETGDKYSMQPGEVHESHAPVPAISVIVKDAATLAQGGSSPRVFIPVGAEPENSFNRDAFDPEWLWSVIAATVRRFE